MRPTGSDYPAGLLAPREPPCLSLYQPTHRSHPDNAQDPVRFGNLVDRLADELARTFPGSDPDALLEPFRRLRHDPRFWNCALDGLAVFAGRGLFRWFRLQRSVPARVIAGARFEITPLIRVLQSADRFQVLALARDDVRLYEGNRYAIDPLPLHPEVPRTLIEALGAEVSPRPGQYGQGSNRDETGKDDERFFRAVDRAVIEHHSRPSGLPLMLATLPQHAALFRAVSHNERLLRRGIEHHPRDLPSAELRSRAWQVLEPAWRARIDTLVEEFGHARAHGRGTDDPAEVESASAAGRVARLLVDERRGVDGRFDEQVLETGGEVIVVPPERMPTRSGVAATYRY